MFCGPVFESLLGGKAQSPRRFVVYVVHCVSSRKGRGNVLSFCVRDRIGCADKPVEGVRWRKPDEEQRKLGAWVVWVTVPNRKTPMQATVNVTGDIDRDAAYQLAEAHLYHMQEVLSAVPWPP